MYTCAFFVVCSQVEAKRLLTDTEGRVWLRIEDAGYMDREGRLWLVGRVKWRVQRGDKAFWSTVVEQKVRNKLTRRHTRYLLIAATNINAI